jgi:dienelactone hydrolase
MVNYSFTAWTADFSATQVRKFSPGGDDLGKFDVQSPNDIVFDGSAIWVTNKDAHTVTKLALDGSELGVFEAGEFPEKIAFDGTDIWVTNSLADGVTRISTDGEILSSIFLGIGRAPLAIAADENYVWVSNGFNKLTRISTNSEEIRDFEIGRITGSGRGRPGSLALDENSVYVTHRVGEAHGTVSQLDHNGIWLSSVEVGGDNPTGLAVLDGNVYVGVDVGSQVAVISPEAFAANAATLPEGVVETDVSIDGSEVKLSGTLTMPAGSGNYPAALLVSGSGENSDDLVFTFRWMRAIAHHLALKGIASLRVDDRGIGYSSGDKLEATIANRTSDVSDALEFLKSQEGVVASKVGLVGHSEGGTVSAAVAAESDVAFVVSLGGTVAPHRDLLPLQAQRFLEADGSAESYVNGVLEDVAYAHNAILTGEGLEQLENEIALGSVVIVAPDYIQGDPKELTTPWFQDFLKYDPASSWSAITEPILALFGDKDWAVPAEQNEPLLREILSSSGNENHHIQVLTGTNHFFQPSETGAIGEIATNPREFIPGFLELISDWISDQTDSE